jgi:hypothetical protein
VLKRLYLRAREGACESASESDWESVRESARECYCCFGYEGARESASSESDWEILCECVILCLSACEGARESAVL